MVIRSCASFWSKLAHVNISIFLHHDVFCIMMQNMRTTVDIPEASLRQIRSQAALEGRKMKDLVNDAIHLYLTGEKTSSVKEGQLPHKAEFQTIGNKRIPVIHSASPGLHEASLQSLKKDESEEDETRFDALFGR